MSRIKSRFGFGLRCAKIAYHGEFDGPLSLLFELVVGAISYPRMHSIPVGYSETSEQYVYKTITPDTGGGSDDG